MTWYNLFTMNLNRLYLCFRFTKEEQTKICCILTTAEYCLETTQQLGDKLKEKIESSLADQIDLSKEQDNFHKLVLCYYFVNKFGNILKV